MYHDLHKVLKRISASFIVMLLALLFFIPQQPIRATSCGDIESYPEPALTSITQTSDGLDLVWETTDDSRFAKYIVVASKNDSMPEAGVNGWMTKITNDQASGYTIDGSLGYTIGDFISFQSNISYYFVVGIEFECGHTTTSNVIQAEFPDLSPSELIKPQLEATKGEKGIILRWSPIDHAALQDVRIVASKIDPNPSYPDNGYVATFNITDSSYIIDNSSSYTSSDVELFLNNTWYYFSLIAKYEVNGQEYYVSSNVKKILYEGPGGGSTGYYKAPTITTAKSTETGFEIVWTDLDDIRLEGYAITVSKDGTPAYPYSGYAVVLDADATTYTISNGTKYTNGNFGGYLSYGTLYNFAVVALYSDRNLMSTSYSNTYIGALPSNLSDFIDLTVRADGSYFVADWTKINDSRIAAVYLVIDPDVESPPFAADSLHAEIRNANGAFSSVINSFKFNQDGFKRNNVPEQLEVGKTYHMMLTVVFRDGTSFSSQPTTFVFEPGDDIVPEVIKEEIISNDPIIDSGISQTNDAVVFREQEALTSIDRSLLPIVKGRVLLQVESAGEGWYVDPVSENKYYLKDAKTAFTALRKFGLGITNTDLAKIPVGFEDRFTDVDTDGDGLLDKLEEGLGTDPKKADTDGDGFSDGEEVRGKHNPLGEGSLSSDSGLVQRLSGRIVLQVEAKGQAWYINPADGMRYYMKDGTAAFDIMRFLSLGITNENLRKISVGLLE